MTSERPKFVSPDLLSFNGHVTREIRGHSRGPSKCSLLNASSMTLRYLVSKSAVQSKSVQGFESSSIHRRALSQVAMPEETSSANLQSRVDD